MRKVDRCCVIGSDSQFGENDQRRRELDGRGDGQDIVDAGPPNQCMQARQLGKPTFLATD